MTQQVRGLSLYQPWASLMALGEKHVETRSWGTSYRGLVLIHATKQTPVALQALCDAPPFYRAVGVHYLLPPTPEPGKLYRLLPKGCVVATAQIVQCLPTDDLHFPKIPLRERQWGEYTAGRYGWFFTEIAPLRDPIPCSGKQGLWTVDPALAHEVLRALDVQYDTLHEEDTEHF